MNKPVLSQADRHLDKSIGGTSHMQSPPRKVIAEPAQTIADGFKRGHLAYARLVGGLSPHIRIEFAPGRAPKLDDPLPAMIDVAMLARPALSFRVMQSVVGCSRTQHQRLLRELSKRGLIVPARKGEAAAWKGRG
jgi:hypothetical protein